MNKYVLADLIRRLRAGKASDEDKYLLEQIWQEAMRDTSYLDSLSEAERETLKKKMFAATQEEIGRRTQPRKVAAWRPWAQRAAAAFVLLFAVAAVVYWNANRYTEVHTGYGERIAVTLPDNSTVTLNGNSVLRYHKLWDNEHTREVWIDGEGFFAVQHTVNHQKFVVHASDQLNVEVLGTKFNVKSREKKSEVMLTEGKVKLDMQNTQAKASSVFLAPGELATLGTDRHLSKRTVKQKQYTSWLQYTLYFDRTTLRDIAVLLKDTYGLDVVFDDATLQDRELSGEISSASINDILYAIAETFNLSVTREGTSVYISSK
jgi:ferric-dicitrate binding protein FerR (iron transport regulator)